MTTRTSGVPGSVAGRVEKVIGGDVAPPLAVGQLLVSEIWAHQRRREAEVDPGHEQRHDVVGRPPAGGEDTLDAVVTAMVITGGEDALWPPSHGSVEQRSGQALRDQTIQTTENGVAARELRE